MASTKFHWQFPLKQFFFLRIELVFLAVIGVLLFLISFFGSGNNFLAALLYTLVFLGLYLIVSYLVQKLRHVEEHYHLSSSHLHIVKKSNNKVIKEVQLPLKTVKKHKLDKCFLGGYLVTHKGKRHVLFFNTKQELEKFERLIKNLFFPRRKV